MKKTAVQWLIEQLTEIHPEAFEQAKAMEKEQIILAHINGQSEIDAYSYYEKTFKSE